MPALRVEGMAHQQASRCREQQGISGPLSLGRVLFGIFQHPLVNGLDHHRGIDIRKTLILIAAEDFLVADRSLADQFDNVRTGKRLDDQIEFAEEAAVIGPWLRFSSAEPQIIARDLSAPAFFADDRTKLEAGEVIRKLAQAVFDVFGKLDSKIAMQFTELVFSHCPFDTGLVFVIAHFMAALDGLLQSLIKIHVIYFADDLKALQCEPGIRELG